MKRHSRATKVGKGICMSDCPTWNAARAARAIAAGGRFDLAKVYRAVYVNNRDVFRVWGYRTEDGEFVSLGDKAAFLSGTKVYDKPFEHHAESQAGQCLPFTDCVNADCADVAEGMIRCGLNPVVLNLASRHNACGGYDSGAGAQEESLCRVSTLSQSLYQYFDPSQRCAREAEVEPRGNAYPLDINFGGIYSPGVTFFRHGPMDGFEFRKKPFRCGVISVAALNFRENTRYVNGELKYKAADGGFTPEGDAIQMNKIRTTFRIALANGHDSLVLGAFGCGAFQLPPESVAEQFSRVLAEPEFERCFRAVVFAILSNPADAKEKFAPFYCLFGRELNRNNMGKENRKRTMAPMLYAAAMLLSAFALGCSEKKDEVFTIEEANMCLLESDKHAVMDAVELIKKAESEEDEGLSAEYFEKAYGPIQELYAKSRDDDSAAGRKRSAALAWVLIDFSYNNAPGSCAKWVLYAERLGLLEAHRIVADPPEKLRGYLLPPELQ